MTPINKRRILNFKKNRRGYWSSLILLSLFIISLFANIIANDRPLLINFDNKFYLPIINDHSEKVFGGDFDTVADFRDPYVKELINKNGWIIWPLIPFSYDTINYDLPSPAPSPKASVSSSSSDPDRPLALPTQDTKMVSSGDV